MDNTVRKFDSLEYSNELRKVGFTEEQANLQAKALSSLVDDHLLTKKDLVKLETKVEHGFQELRGDIKESELRLTVRLTGITTLIVGGVGALLRFFPTGHP